jgi:Formate hydrogenlyase subunit 6/NADH:ubiquinone oxidoreductase 23 kD subunit (chain I)
MEYKDKKYTYLGGLVHGISTLATGMKTSIKVYFRKKVTEQYPENRKELKMFDRFRGTLNMPHNENNEHRCVACGLCQMACPNDTIKVTSETVETEDGKKKKIWQPMNMIWVPVCSASSVSMLVRTMPSRSTRTSNMQSSTGRNLS